MVEFVVIVVGCKVKKIKTYMFNGEFDHYKAMANRKEVFDEKPVTITEGHDEPIDQTAIGFLLGCLCGVVIGFVVILYCSTIPLGQ